MYPFVSSYYKKTNKIKSRDYVKEEMFGSESKQKLKEKRYLILANTLTDML